MVSIEHCIMQHMIHHFLYWSAVKFQFLMLFIWSAQYWGKQDAMMYVLHKQLHMWKFHHSFDTCTCTSTASPSCMFIIIQYREFVRAQKKFELHATRMWCILCCYMSVTVSLCVTVSKRAVLLGWPIVLNFFHRI